MSESGGIVNREQYNPIGPLIFLDMDGVLNGHDYDPSAKSNTILRSCVDRLNRVLEETDARIVLSSAWRYMLIGKAMSLRGFDYLLRTHGVIADRLIGATCADEEVRERGWQIQTWRRLHDHRGPYVVIDDMDLHIKPLHGDRFVQPNGQVGLSDDDASRAIELLKS